MRTIRRLEREGRRGGEEGRGGGEEGEGRGGGEGREKGLKEEDLVYLHRHFVTTAF